MKIPDTVVELPFIRADDCGAWADRVFRNKCYLVNHLPPHYTLGVPSYTALRRDQYPTLANIYNRMLIDEFARLYAGLCSVLAVHFVQRVGFIDDGVLRPSFNVFTHDAAKMEDPIHIDDEWGLIPALDGREWTDHFSFTAPIKMPKAGAGLDIWYDESAADINRYHLTPDLINYKLGKLYVHSGAHPHRIHQTPAEVGEVRITLQGHGVNTPEGIVLYW